MTAWLFRPGGVAQGALADGASDKNSGLLPMTLCTTHITLAKKTRPTTKQGTELQFSIDIMFSDAFSRILMAIHEYSWES